jgi:hypothetical protein
MHSQDIPAGLSRPDLNPAGATILTLIFIIIFHTTNLAQAGYKLQENSLSGSR